MGAVFDFPLTGPYWILEQAVNAYNHYRDVERCAGWLARLRRHSFDDVPFAGYGAAYETPALRTLEDEVDPEELRALLAQALNAKGQGQMDQANIILGRINYLLHCAPFRSAGSVQDAMVEAGFGRMVFVETDLDMPDEYDAAG